MYIPYLEVLKEFEAHMLQKDALCSIMRYSGQSHLERIADNMLRCGTYVDIGVDNSGELKVVNANFCRERLCSVCQWRRSLKMFGYMTAAVEALSEAYAFLHVVLSRPNICASELGTEIRELYAASGRFFRHSDVKAAVRGYLRCTEVTYNEEDNEYHPHLHITVAVPASYFNSRLYIKRQKWVEAWNEANFWDRDKMGYDLSCFVQRVDDSPKAVAELAKYSTKPIDIRHGHIAAALEQLYIYSTVLKGRRMIYSSGVMREQIADDKLLRLENLSDLNSTGAKWLGSYDWNGESYSLCNGII